jgi:hypothetical protein
MSTMTYPKKYTGDSAPAQIVELVGRLIPALLSGQQPVHAVLLEQFNQATIREIELTGVGFFVEFDTPTDVPLTTPSDITGGHAEIVLEGVPNGAGCILWVCEGRLSTLEGFTYGDEGWPDDARVVRIENVIPICTNGAA